MLTEPTPISSSTIVATTVLGSHNFWINDFSNAKRIHTGDHLSSGSFSVGGHSWHVAYLPNGDCVENADCISFFLVLEDNSTVMADFTVSILDQAGKPWHTKRSRVCFFEGLAAHLGFNRFIERERLEKSRLLENDCFVVKCDVTVTVTVTTGFHTEGDAAAVPVFVKVPPPDCLSHFHNMLLSGEGADVKFLVDGKEFTAHRCVLAARSPVFRAQFFGTMKEGTVTAQCQVEIADIRHDVFANLLHFIYTDSLYGTKSVDEVVPMAQHLLVAADRFNLERLKKLCEQSLCDNIDVKTVVTSLALAEKHNCCKLKECCCEFLKRPGVLQVILEDDFLYLTESCPLVLKEIVSTLAQGL